MTESPEERFKSAAKGVIGDALASQAELTAQLNEQATQFIPKKYGDYGKVLQKIGKASGRTFPEYVKTAEGRFFNTAKNLTEQGRADLRGFEPGLIDSGSTRKTYRDLTRIGQDFARGVQQVGEQGRDRLFALPEQATKAINVSFNNPATNVLRDPQYMNLAQNPPTIQNDAMNMYRSLFTYNV
jgi:hypothetical protein